MRALLAVAACCWCRLRPAGPGPGARAARRSRCRTRSWNCGGRCRRCRTSRARGGAARPIGRRRRYPPPPVRGGSDLVAQLLSRVDALEEQVRQLRGQIDETQNQVQRQGADLGKRIDDLAFQTQNPGGGAAGAGRCRHGPGQPTPHRTCPGMPPPSRRSERHRAVPPGPTGAPAGPVRRTPELAHPGGQCRACPPRLSGRRTGGARGADRQPHLAARLRRAVPAGPGADRPAAIFPGGDRLRRHLQPRAGKGAHAQDALLGLANSLIAINEKKAACDTLAKLRAEYPSPRPDMRDAIAGSPQRAGCR